MTEKISKQTFHDWRAKKLVETEDLQDAYHEAYNAIDRLFGVIDENDNLNDDLGDMVTNLDEGQYKTSVYLKTLKKYTFEEFKTDRHEEENATSNRKI